MKKKIKYLLFIVLCNLFITKVYAASASIKASASSSKVQVGDTVTIKVNVSSGTNLGSWGFNVGYNSKVFSLVSSTLENNLTSLGVVSNASTKNKEYTLKFKAKESGSGTFSINNAEIWSLDEEQLSPSISNATVTVVSNSSSSNASSNSNKSSNNTSNKDDDKKKSANNYLSSLEVDGYKLSPSFNKNTTKYNISVPNDVNEVKISGKADDKEAAVSGLGKHDVKEGKNRIDITVTAENGNKKTYTINVTVKDKEPVVVKIGDDEYTVMRSSDGLKIPNSYDEITITINDTEVPAYKSSLTNYTLVGLTDKNGKSALYIYNDNRYELYNEYKFNGVTLYIKQPDEDKMIKNTKEDKIKINDEEVVAYILEGNSYPLIYGMNIETGEENWYTYDESEKTLQKFVIGNKNSADYDKGSKKGSNLLSFNNVGDKYKLLSYILGGISSILIIFLFIGSLKISKLNRKEIVKESDKSFFDKIDESNDNNSADNKEVVKEDNKVEIKDEIKEDKKETEN